LNVFGFLDVVGSWMSIFQQYHMVVQNYMDWLYNLHEHLGSPPDFGGVRVAHLVGALLCIWFLFSNIRSCIVFSGEFKSLWVIECIWVPGCCGFMDVLIDYLLFNI
jgi:hypothetical protein